MVLNKLNDIVVFPYIFIMSGGLKIVYIFNSEFVDIENVTDLMEYDCVAQLSHKCIIIESFISTYLTDS